MTSVTAPAGAMGTAGDMYDVIVSGFGPAGATLANLLGQRGIHTLVVDKSRTIYELPRAFALDHEIMRTFQNLGIAGAVLPHTRPFTASEYYGVGGQLIKRLGSVPPPYPMGWTPNLVFSQPPVEGTLREAATARASVRVALGTELVGLQQNDSSVIVQLRDDSGDERSATGRYLVGCDGAWSAVRELTGLRYEDLEFDEPWLVVDLLVSDEGLKKLPDVSIQYCDPSRPCTYLVGPGNHRRWEIMVLPGEDRRVLEQDEHVWRLLSRWLTQDDATLWRRASYQFHALVAGEWRRGRAFIAGDAAHQQPPFTGQGMCQGVRDVTNLAWKLDLVLRGRASATLLDTYGLERKAHVRRLTSVIKSIGTLICERDPAKARERDARLLAEAGGTIRTMPRQDLIPPLEHGCLSPRAHSANGTLFPQPLVRNSGRETLLDDLTGARFRIVTNDPATLAGERIPGLAASLDACVVRLATGVPAVDETPAHPPHTLVVGETEGVLAGWFARHRACAALVRPDHYVYGVAADAGALVEQLEALIRALGAGQSTTFNPSAIPSAIPTQQRSAA